MDDPLEWAGAEVGIETVGSQLGLCCVGDLKADSTLGKTVLEGLELNIDNLAEIVELERTEPHHVVNPVHEFRSEEVERITGQVRGHDENDVAEVNRSTLAVGEATIVEKLQQHAKHIGMRFFDLVEEHHRVGTTTHRFGELTTLVVADVSRRRTNEATHRVLLHVLAHIDANHRTLVIEQELGQRSGELGLADTRGAEEQEATDGTMRVGQAGPTSPDRVGDHGDCVVLTNHPLVQYILEANELVDLARHESRHRHAGPLRDHFGDIFFVDLFFEHLGTGLQLVQCSGGGLDSALELWYLSVPDRRRLLEIGLAIDDGTQRLEQFFLLADLVDGFLLGLPMGSQIGEALGEVRYL